MTETTVFVATSDVSGLTRGRAVPGQHEDAVLRKGVGWVPANLALNCFGLISENPFGATGDLRLIPDLTTRIEIPAGHGRPGVRLYLANQTLLDGTPWECDPREFARRAFEALRERFGLEVIASFEHEFMVDGLEPTAPFSLERYRTIEPFGSELVDLLYRVGLEPETWLPEYGDNQFEITLAPSGALVAADRAVLLKDLVRDLARRHGIRVTFAPLVQPDRSGNGVHVHISLRDIATGLPVLFDDSQPGGLSITGRRFSAGILQHARALTAITAPSPISFLRLTPHRWSAGGIFLAEKNREALLRICPTSTVGGGLPTEQFHLEFRAADATANPYLALGVLVRAGIEGLDSLGADAASETLPVVWPEETTDSDLAGVPPLPRDLEEALVALETDDVVTGWFAPHLLEIHLAVKRDELAAVANLDSGERCAMVASVY